ncbi:MAG: transporter substrate-binding domain-containing protein [Muribaculaceae bacterium]|nr:transporter substrate-binding domain-containing protein [Muribaculaceae bacterium]
MLRRNSSLHRGQLWLYLVLIALTVLAMAGLRNCRNHSNAPSLRHSGGDTIDVAIEYSPVSFYSYADTMGGFNYDFLRLVAAHHGCKFKFHPIVSLSAALSQLQDGVFDILAAQFPVTAENRKLFLFTEPLYIDRQVLVQRRDPAGALIVKSQLDLAGRTVRVVAGSPMKQRIMGLSREIGDTIRVIEDSQYGPEQIFLLVATGDDSLAVINEAVARRLAQRYPQVDISTGISFSQFQALTLRKGDMALCDSLNLWIRQLKATRDYESLSRRYLK